MSSLLRSVGKGNILYLEFFTKNGETAERPRLIELFQAATKLSMVLRAFQ